MQFEEEKSLEAKKRLALRRNEPELREFEQKLRDALTFKEHIIQMKEKRHRDIQREIEKRRESEILTKILMEKEDTKIILSEENRAIKKTYANILLLQMDLQKQTEKQKEEENYLEKIKLNELEEELLHIKMMEKENKKNKSEKCLQEMTLYEKMKKIQDLKSKLTEAKEEVRNEHYIKLKEEREMKRNLEFKLKMKRKEETFEKIAQNALSLEKAVDERMKLIKELQDHEYKLKAMPSDKEVEKKDLFRKELVKMLKVQIELHAEHEKILKEEEMKFKNQLMEQAKEEEMLEREDRIIFDLINKKYSLDIQLQMEANQIKSQKQKELTKSTMEYINQYNQEKMAEIENEKIALIEEYNAQ